MERKENISVQERQLFYEIVDELSHSPFQVVGVQRYDARDKHGNNYEVQRVAVVPTWEGEGQAVLPEREDLYRWEERTNEERGTVHAIEWVHSEGIAARLVKIDRFNSDLMAQEAGYELFTPVVTS